MEPMYIACSILFLMCTVVAQPPSNDNACNATLIHIGDSVVADLTNEATKQTGEMSPGRDAYNGLGQDGWFLDIDVQNSIWYKVTAFELELEMVEYSGVCINTQLAVYTVTDCADFSTFTLIKANDNSGCYGLGAHIFPFTECATQEYYIQVDSYYGYTDTFQMDVAGMEEGECPAMTNDNVCDASQIAVGDVVIDVLTQYGTNQSNEISPYIDDCTGQSGWCAWEPWDQNVQNSLWYKVTASELELEMVCYAGVCVDTQLAVYTATDCGDFSTFTLVKANDDSNTSVAAHILPFNTSNNITQCVEYYIQVDGGALPGRPEGIATGFFQMNVIGECECNSCTAAPSSAPSSVATSAPTTSLESSESSDSKTSESISEDSDDRKKKRKKKKRQKQKSSSDSAAYALFENEELDDPEMNMASKTKRVVLQFSDSTVMNVWLLFCVILTINVIFVCVWYTTKK